jgi:hypothetical protein
LSKEIFVKKNEFDLFEAAAKIGFMGEELRLSESNRETLRNFIATMIQRTADFGPKPDLERVVNSLDEFISSMNGRNRAQLFVLIQALERGTITQGFRHYFSNLNPDEQRQYLYKMEASSNYAFRGIILAIKSITFIVYFSEPEAMQAVGFDGKCLLEDEPGPHKDELTTAAPDGCACH